MNKLHNNINEAKRSLKEQIHFLETLLDHLKGTDKDLRIKALFGAWCLHRYINDKLMWEVEAAIDQNVTEIKKQTGN